MIEISDEKFQKHYKYILNQLMSDSQEDPNLSEINEVNQNFIRFFRMKMMLTS